MEYRNIECRRIVYGNYQSDRSKQEILSLDCVYDMFQLLNGVDQFMRTGNAERLQECYDTVGSEDTKRLVNRLVDFSHTISLCDIGKIDEIVEGLSTALDAYEQRKTQGELFESMFSDLTELIRRKLDIGKNGLSYPRLIEWCLDNGMLQQALTLYIEKMPQFYYNEGLLSMPVMELNKFGNQSDVSAAFYGDLYDWYAGQGEACCSAASSKIEGQEGIIKNLAEELKVYIRWADVINFETMHVYIGQNKQQLENKKIYEAFSRIESYIKTNFDKSTGKRLERRCVKEGVNDDARKFKNKLEAELETKTALKFLNMVANGGRDWRCYFLFNRPEECNTSEVKLSQSTYLKKETGLSRVKSMKEKYPYAHIGKNVLYEIMKYYLALKLMRNRINHASEGELSEKENAVISVLQEKHGLCMEISYGNIKNLISCGLRAHLEDMMNGGDRR